MNFASPTFIVFYCIVLLAWHFLKNRGTTYTLFMLAASYYFYMSWNPKFILLIIFSTIVDYFVGPRIYHSKTPQKRRLYLGVSLISNLGLLGFFKYTHFILDSLSPLLIALHITSDPLPLYEITLPVGISFYTFQTLSYSIDIYRKKIKPEKNFLRFALFVAFFPQLVAGPIVRASHFLPQLSRRLYWQMSRVSDGIWLISLGLFKKVYLSASFAPFSDSVFSRPELWNSSETWMGVIAYSLQIYCDFSGYSDIAIGVAKIMGYDFPRNFNMPYAAHNISEFWRRWHISLSSWLRDYLYIPLGGSRNGTAIMLYALMGTMLLGGLWHGAKWTFVFWGLLHGLFLIAHKLWSHLKNTLGWQKIDHSIIWKITAHLLTILSVVIAFVFFRASDMATALTVLGNLTQPLLIPDTLYIPYFFTLGIVVLAHFITPFYMKKWGDGKLLMHRRVILLLMLLAVISLAPIKSSPFIYFQF